MRPSPRSSRLSCAQTLLLTLVLAPVLGLSQATPTTKQAPPPGIQVSAADTAKLTAGLEALGRQIGALGTNPKVGADRLRLLPDLQVFHKAVRYALQHGEFFKADEIESARAQLAVATHRAQELAAGQAGWTSATGPMVCGYLSKIDGSVQPYGLIVPADWKPGDQRPRPLYLWFHGRNDKLSEVAFIAGRLKAKREFAPATAFELHLYGRYCNASKFAGEIDAFEALQEVQQRWPIDEDRLVPMGFSMGGASVWHLATHYASRWAAASPGAGFAETAIYAKVFDTNPRPRPWEQKLFRLYDATVCAANLANVPLIAYSGELDPQKQSAEIMSTALGAEGLTLERLVGPQTGHQYEPQTKQTLANRIDALVAQGRVRVPARVRIVTYTLRYHQMAWIIVEGLQQHWERSEIDAQILDRQVIQAKTTNITAFTMAFPAGTKPLDPGAEPRIVIDGQPLLGPAMKDGWTARFRKSRGAWTVASAEDSRITKRHGLTGPIDDAFMDSFLFVRPTGRASHQKVEVWAGTELERAILEWRRVFRGEPRVKNDREVTAEDIANHHLVLWGDPGANAVLSRLLGKLPLQWTAATLALGSHVVSADEHAPILIYPNPLNPRRYVVLNSGFTFRQGSTTSNSLQTPKLPDWALIDLRTPPSLRWPGLVVEAGFFDEEWQLTAR